jgi:platelet-activating factor acetylhydrolase
VSNVFDRGHIGFADEYGRWQDGEDTSVDHFRTLQLEMRVREVYETYYGFKALVEDAEQQSTLGVKIGGMKEDDQMALLRSFNNPVDFNDLSLTGHSFGGGTMVSFVACPISRS